MATEITTARVLRALRCCKGPLIDAACRPPGGIITRHDRLAEFKK
jgi:hypothetical protein